MSCSIPAPLATGLFPRTSPPPPPPPRPTFYFIRPHPLAPPSPPTTPPPPPPPNSHLVTLAVRECLLTALEPEVVFFGVLDWSATTFRSWIKQIGGIGVCRVRLEGLKQSWLSALKSAHSETFCALSGVKSVQSLSQLMLGSNTPAAFVFTQRRPGSTVLISATPSLHLPNSRKKVTPSSPPSLPPGDKSRFPPFECQSRSCVPLCIILSLPV